MPGRAATRNTDTAITAAPESRAPIDEIEGTKIMTPRPHDSNDLRREPERIESSTPAPPSTHAPEDPTATPPPSSPPPPTASLGKTLALLLVLCAVFALGALWGDSIVHGLGSAWRAVVGDEEDRSSEASDTFYTCGMHPWVILPEPGLCPICHMELTPLDPAKFSGEVAIDPRVVQNIGVRVAPVVSGPLVRTVRTVGTVTYDETRVRDVNTKVGGWIEKLYVDYLGARVEKGEPLFDLFSRELYDTQQQYLLSLRSRAKEDPGFLAGKSGDRERLLDSSRLRLEYYDIPPEQIAELESRGEPQKTMAIVSPHSGVVIEKHANEGMLVDPGMLVYRIADLSKVWVIVTLYEYQLPFVSVGQRAVMTLPYIPGATFEGKVIYVYPFLDKKTREVQVRLEFDNPELFLKPGMFANVHLESVLADDRVLAPRSAILDTGERQVAFVSLGEGRFDPRDVRTGVETDAGLVEVIDGLRPGELVVTSGQFLIDSEAKIREALAKMIRGDLAAESPGAARVADAPELPSQPPAMATELAALLDAYFEIGGILASDAVAGIDAPARRIARAIDRLLAIEPPRDPRFWHRHEEAARIRGEALELVGKDDLAAARLDYADLSIALEKLVRAAGVPPDYPAEVHHLHCPMYREGQGGGSWLQTAGDVRNPFFGASMLRCFDERVALPFAASGEDASDEGGEAAPIEGEEKGDHEHDGDGDPEQAPPDDASGDASRDADPHAGHTHDGATAATSGEAEARAAAEPFKRLMDAYLAFGHALARDSTEGAAMSLRAISTHASELASSTQNEAVKPLAEKVAASARERTETSDLEKTRDRFKKISSDVIPLVRAMPGAGKDRPLFETYCPMAKASWIDDTPTVTNPYHGSQMLRCGEVVREISGDEDTEGSKP